jgi:GntR family transcriptional repressor for pyruvate dehydrogenase complex
MYEQIVRQIKDMIVQGLYKKGDFLPSEKELMDMTGVSRITIRDALRVLVELGIIATRHGKGSFVLLDAGDIGQAAVFEENIQRYRDSFQQSIQTRLIFEPEICKLAAKNRTEKEIEELECFLDDDKGQHNGSEQPDSHEAFHRKIVEMTHNPFHIKIYAGLIALEHRYMPLMLVPPDRQKSVALQIKQHHLDIFEAVKAGDGEFAYFYMKKHTLYLVEKSSEYFDFFL